MREFVQKISIFLGFNKNSKAVTKYLREANIRSGVYMAAVITILEVWLIIRQTIKYIGPMWVDTANKLELIFSYTSNFFLFFFLGISIFTFCLTFQRKMSAKKFLITNAITSGITLLYCFTVFWDFHLNYDSLTKSGTVDLTFSGKISISLLVAIYALSFLTTVAIIGYCLLVYFKKVNNPALLTTVMSLFALMCVAFGVKVSYSDYISRNPKEIICFLTMIIYGASFIIWRPYISIILNVILFVGFYFLISNGNLMSASSFFQSITGVDPNTVLFDKIKADSYTGFEVGKQFSLTDWDNYLISFKDGDLVNYITFFISFTMVCISLYHQRRNDAIKDEELQFIADYDELTGLHNYSYFVRTVHDIKERQNKRILFINLDNFKTYNDQRGFNEGNKLLKTAGEIMQRHFNNQYVCRQSDDHYVAFVDEENLHEIIIDLNEEIKALDSKILPEIKVGSYQPLDDEDVRRAVDKARYACSTIKQNHTKVHVEYNKQMHDEYHLMQYVIHNVDRAVNEGWVRPYYQPVVWSKDGKMCSVEALARWNDPERGMLPPGKFVPTLEDTKLIHKLDSCIIERVCQDLRDALDLNDGIPVVPVSINFSRLDFELMDVVSLLDTLIEKYNIPKDLIHVEITESALTDKDDNLTRSIHLLKEKGYALWLDDFGSGYSSLNVLKDFEFDVLKIDMKFLSGFSNNPRTKPLIEAVIQMAVKLKMRTLTEGVETKEEMDFLNKVHCERLQGYLFGKPIPHEELKERIKKGEIIVSRELW